MKYNTLQSKDYPDLLSEISDMPSRLYISGAMPNMHCIGIVGSRTPTNYGREVTYRLAYDLSSLGICLISGLAYGVDTIVHQAAIDAGGQTIAVLGSGLDNIYPRSNQKLAENIANGHGAVISEYAPDEKPLPFNFPRRNRIIAGLSQAIIVTEANAKSGSLITAAQALNENRVVTAVPGNITSPRSAGPNYLIKLGATPITDAQDVVSALGIEIGDTNEKSLVEKPKISTIQAGILELIQSGIVTTPALVEQNLAPASDTIIAIGGLEMSGLIKQLAMGQWSVARTKSGVAKSSAKL